MKRSIVLERSTELGLAIVELYKVIREREPDRILSRQLLRSGTNPGAMVHEAFYAESGKDFIHKLRIALKEVHESHYWIMLLEKSGYLTNQEKTKVNDLLTQVKRLLISSIKTRESNLK
ncbi:MAG: four helix bundle protein [Bacteroidota bacterium]